MNSNNTTAIPMIEHTKYDASKTGESILLYWLMKQKGFSMKLKLIRQSGTALLCVLSLLLVATAFAQGKQDFTVNNQTGVEIHELYVCPHDSNDWEDDILGKDTLPNGESLVIHFSRKETARLWDLKIVDSDGNSVEWENLNLLKISEVTLHKKGSRVWADVK